MLQNKDLNSYKVNVKAASTANVFITTIFPIVDGYQTVNGDRVLLKNQNDPKTNGIYICYKNGLTLDTDSDNNTSYINGAFTRTTNGIVNLNKEFYCPPIQPTEYYTTYKLWNESPFGGSGGGGSLPTKQYVYLVQDSDDALKMGGDTENVFTNAQEAYERALTLNPLLTITNAELLLSPNRILITTSVPHNYQTGNSVILSGLTGITPGWINLNGEKIITVTGPNTFTYSITSAATSLSPYLGGGTVRTNNDVVIKVGVTTKLSPVNSSIVLDSNWPTYIKVSGINEEVSVINTIVNPGKNLNVRGWNNVKIGFIINQSDETNVANFEMTFCNNLFINFLNFQDPPNTIKQVGNCIISDCKNIKFNNILYNLGRDINLGSFITIVNTIGLHISYFGVNAFASGSDTVNQCFIFIYECPQLHLDNVDFYIYHESNDYCWGPLLNIWGKTDGTISNISSVMNGIGQTGDIIIEFVNNLNITGSIQMYSNGEDSFSSKLKLENVLFTGSYISQYSDSTTNFNGEMEFKNVIFNEPFGLIAIRQDHSGSGNATFSAKNCTFINADMYKSPGLSDIPTLIDNTWSNNINPLPIIDITNFTDINLSNPNFLNNAVAKKFPLSTSNPTETINEILNCPVYGDDEIIKFIIPGAGTVEFDGNGVNQKSKDGSNIAIAGGSNGWVEFVKPSYSNLLLEYNANKL